jgi:hypothetical protein
MACRAGPSSLCIALQHALHSHLAPSMPGTSLRVTGRMDFRIHLPLASVTPFRILSLQARPFRVPSASHSWSSGMAGGGGFVAAGRDRPSPAAQRFARLSECTHTLNFDR